MTYYQYARSVKSELEDLNRLIDQKIVRGLSYRHESLRHKQLLREMRRQTARQSRVNGLRHWFSFVSLF